MKKNVSGDGYRNGRIFVSTLLNRQRNRIHQVEKGDGGEGRGCVAVNWGVGRERTDLRKEGGKRRESRIPTPNPPTKSEIILIKRIAAFLVY